MVRMVLKMVFKNGVILCLRLMVKKELIIVTRIQHMGQLDIGLIMVAIIITPQELIQVKHTKKYYLR